MSRSYFTEDQKLHTIPKPNFWDMDTIADMEDIFYKKGYRYVTCDIFRDQNGILHNAWSVPREHVGIIIERLFQKRIMVLVEATGKDKANIIFVCNNSSLEVIPAVKGMKKVIE